jgi:hypothetical protein
VEEERLYLVRVYQSVVFPFNEAGECAGETIYAADERISVEPIDAAGAAALTGRSA